MSAQTPTDTTRSAGPPVVGALTDAQTYKNAAYLFLRFPLGVAYFTILVTLISVGLSLTVLVVGLGVLAFVLPVVTYLGSIEAALARELLGRDVDYERPDPGDRPLVPYLKQVATDRRSYLLLGYVFLTFPVGILLFTVFVTLGTLSAASIIAPLVYYRPGVEYELGTLDAFGGVGPVVVDTFPEAVALSLLGVVVGLVTVHLTNVLARAHGAVLAFVLD
jgi:hypothetical protein